MSRITAREIAVHLVFELDFSERSVTEVLSERLTVENFQSFADEYKIYEKFPDQNDSKYIERVLSGVYEHIPELDSYIEKYAIGWSFGRISRISVCIMRVSMYEIMYMPDVPRKAAINAAVDLAKAYESPEAAAFINGVLGSFVRGEPMAEEG